MIDQRSLTIKLNQVILIEGFQKMSMSKLATEVDVSRATLYLYFKNKDEIVQAVVARHLRFITERPVPAQFDSSSFLKVLLNSLLLMGATTEKFTTDLQHAFPELARELRLADSNYFNDLAAYVLQAQKADFMVATYNQEFVLFQAETLIKAILQRVMNHQITLNQAERFLEDSIDLQLNGLLTQTAKETIDSALFDTLKSEIRTEFHATYALVS